MNKLQTTLKKYSTVPSKDFLGNSIDIGDVILIAQYSKFTVGKVVSLSDKGMTITCEKIQRASSKWNRTTRTYEPTEKVYVTNTIPWTERQGLEYVKKALSKHNATHRIPVYRKQDSTIQETLNLTKLNLYHESTQD